MKKILLSMVLGFGFACGYGPNMDDYQYNHVGNHMDTPSCEPISNFWQSIKEFLLTCCEEISNLLSCNSCNLVDENEGQKDELISKIIDQHPELKESEEELNAIGMNDLESWDSLDLVNAKMKIAAATAYIKSTQLGHN